MSSVEEIAQLKALIEELRRRIAAQDDTIRRHDEFRAYWRRQPTNLNR